MGYSADKIHGDPIAIPMTKAFQFTELLRTAEADFGHISWCDTVETYETRLDNKYPSIVEAIMTDFGFLTTWSDDNESVLLYSWGGDKIGSSWDNVWDAIAEIVEHDVLWVMVGEDQQVWAERIINGKRVTDSVDFNQLVR